MFGPCAFVQAFKAGAQGGVFELEAAVPQRSPCPVRQQPSCGLSKGLLRLRNKRAVFFHSLRKALPDVRPGHQWPIALPRSLRAWPAGRRWRRHGGAAARMANRRSSTASRSPGSASMAWATEFSSMTASASSAPALSRADTTGAKDARPQSRCPVRAAVRPAGAGIRRPDRPKGHLKRRSGFRRAGMRSEAGTGATPVRLPRLQPDSAPPTLVERIAQMLGFGLGRAQADDGRIAGLLAARRLCGVWQPSRVASTVRRMRRARPAGPPGLRAKTARIVHEFPPARHRSAGAGRY